MLLVWGPAFLGALGSQLCVCTHVWQAHDEQIKWIPRVGPCCKAGRVPKGEFVNRARAIGVTGAVSDKFRALDLWLSSGFTV